MSEKWGFLREISTKASGKDGATGLHRTGFDDYLKVIFPNASISDWIHDKIIPNSGKRFRPDWRNDNLHLVIEFDGVQHYQKPTEIIKDIERTAFYEGLGYKVIRIPFFIQLSNDAVKELFNVDVKEMLFDEIKYPSMNVEDSCTPAFMCPAGIERMAKEFKRFPIQYQVNVDFLEKYNDDFLTGVTLLKNAYAKL